MPSRRALIGPAVITSLLVCFLSFDNYHLGRHLAGKLTTHFKSVGGNRIRDSYLPGPFRTISYEPYLKFGVWRYISDLSVFAKSNVKVSPFQKTAQFRTTWMWNFPGYPSPILQAAYDSHRKDVTLSMGVKF